MTAKLHPPNPGPPPADDYYRQVDGRLSIQTVKAAPTVRLELLTRLSDEPIAWRFRQPAVSLFWWQSGFQRYSIDLDGQATRNDDARRSSMTLVPPSMDARGEFHNDQLCNYNVAFIDRHFLEDRGRFILDRPLAGFCDEGLERGIKELSLWQDDATYGLMAEGWALQAVARLRRLLDAPIVRPIAAGGLSGAILRRVENYIRGHLHEPIGLTELAALAGLSLRHFARAFRASTGQTPARFVHERRLELAKALLTRSAVPITEIALACGFSHAQHFTNSFRRGTGMPPTEFRRSQLA